MERLGIVFIAASHAPDQGLPVFTGYWDRGDPPEMLEEGPGWERAEDAISWARERAPRVLVRLGPTEDTIYSAGEVDLTEFSDGSGRRYPLWPPHKR
jgi:hypothetical protein